WPDRVRECRRRRTTISGEGFASSKASVAWEFVGGSPAPAGATVLLILFLIPYSLLSRMGPRRARAYNVDEDFTSVSGAARGPEHEEPADPSVLDVTDGRILPLQHAVVNGSCRRGQRCLSKLRGDVVHRPWGC